MHANMSDEDDEDAADGEVRQDGIYRPPKLAPMPYTESSGKDKRSRRAPIPTALSSLAQLDPSKPYLESTSDDLVCLGNGHGSVNNDCVEELITNETEQTVTFPGEVSVAHERKRDCSSSHP